MFADDTSLFSTVTNETVTAEVLNRVSGVSGRVAYTVFVR